MTRSTGARHRLAAMGRLHRVGMLIGCVTLVGLINATPASAAGATFSITPTSKAPYFIFNSSSGSTVRGQVRVVNVSSTTGRAKLYSVDATTGQTSGAVYKSAGAARHGVGAWLKLATSSLSLGPHQGAQVPFTVHVPSGMPGGQYLGGLVAAPIKPVTTKATKRGKSSFHVNIQEIAIVAVQVDLPGPLTHKLEITNVQASGRPGYQTLPVSLTNAGNTLIKGRGKLTVFKAGRQVFAAPFSLDTMVPHTSIAYPVYVRGKRLPPGSYTGHVRVVYAGNHIAQGTFPFTISSNQVRKTYGTTVPPGAPISSGSSSVPIWAIALGGVALIAVSIGGSAFYFRRRLAKR
jgi:Protein of unknown function C-terminal (DUF3324)